MCFYHKNPHHPAGCRRTLMGQQGSLGVALNFFSSPLSQICCGKFHPRFLLCVWVSDTKQSPFQSITSQVPRGFQGALKENVLKENEKVHHGTARDSSL